jgi:hypothetical protein
MSIEASRGRRGTGSRMAVRPSCSGAAKVAGGWLAGQEGGAGREEEGSRESDATRKRELEDAIGSHVRRVLSREKILCILNVKHGVCIFSHILILGLSRSNIKHMRKYKHSNLHHFPKNSYKNPYSRSKADLILGGTPLASPTIKLI